MTGYLSRFPRFATLPADDLELLERVFVVQEYRPGHVFLREGDLATATNSHLYAILDGHVAVAAEAPVNGFGVRRTLGPGDLFGLISFLDDGPRSATCTAEGPVKAAWLSRAAFRELYRSRVGVYARFQMVVARQLAADIRSLDRVLENALK